MYLQRRHRNQTATTTTVRCNQLQWLPPPSSPASRGRYRAGREGDPRSAMSPRWIFRTVTPSRSLRSKCRRRGGESRVSRSASRGGRRGDVVWECSVFKNACVHRKAQTCRLHALQNLWDPSVTERDLTSVICCSRTSGKGGCHYCKHVTQSNRKTTDLGAWIIQPFPSRHDSVNK